MSTYFNLLPKEINEIVNKNNSKIPCVLLLWAGYNNPQTTLIAQNNIPKEILDTLIDYQGSQLTGLIEKIGSEAWMNLMKREIDCLDKVPEEYHICLILRFID